MSYYVEIVPESRTKKPASLDTIKNKLTRLTGLIWIINPYQKRTVCAKFFSDSTFNKKILPAIAKIESTSKVDLIVTYLE